eukprot:GHRR01010597.1.p2 GENE.GHRR01010597.1~~GHRR01010597.1.p2  ORF type:complete len:142 (+),score=53.38 GHRR01010597.1:1029-1454(+)
MSLNITTHQLRQRTQYPLHAKNAVVCTYDCSGWGLCTKVCHLETTQEKVLSLKLDTKYWPTWELRRDPMTCSWGRYLTGRIDCTNKAGSSSDSNGQQPTVAAVAAAGTANVGAGTGTAAAASGAAAAAAAAVGADTAVGSE